MFTTFRSKFACWSLLRTLAVALFSSIYITLLWFIFNNLSSADTRPWSVVQTYGWRVILRKTAKPPQRNRLWWAVNDTVIVMRNWTDIGNIGIFSITAHSEHWLHERELKGSDDSSYKGILSWPCEEHSFPLTSLCTLNYWLRLRDCGNRTPAGGLWERRAALPDLALYGNHSCK